MTSKVQIANRALSKVGQPAIISLTDNDKPARTINQMFDIVRDAELRAHNWCFAIKRASVAALVEEPIWGFDAQYQLPSDCLRIIQVGEFYPGVDLSDYRGSDMSEWRIEGKRVLTNLESPLKLRYIAQITDTTQYDSMFIEALACRLAAECCEPITESNSKRQLAWDEYKLAISGAIRANAIEVAPEPMPDDTWLISRL